MKKLILLIALLSLSVHALDDVSIPVTFVDSGVIEASDFNENYDSLEQWTKHTNDSIDAAFMRFTDLSSGDSTLTRIQVDSIRSNPDIDSIQGNVYIDSAEVGYLSVSSIGAITTDSITSPWANIDTLSGIVQIDTITGPVIIDTITNPHITTLDGTISGQVNLDSVYTDYVKITGTASGATLPFTDELIIDDSTGAGITFLSDSASTQTIYFGDPQNNTIGGIKYSHTLDKITISADSADLEIGQSQIVINGDGRDIDTWIHGADTSFVLTVNAFDNNVGIRTDGDSLPGYAFYVNGPTLFGAGASNSIEFAADGELTLNGTARVKKKHILANAAIGIGPTAPTSVFIGDFRAFEFDISDDAITTWAVPKTWAVGTDIVINGSWYIDEAYATNSGEVRWQVDWSAVPHDGSEAIDAPTHSGSGNSGDINIPATAKYMVETAIATISGASLALGDELGFTVSRVALGAGADPTADPGLIHLEIEFTCDKLGTGL